MRFDAPVLLYGAGREARSTRAFLKQRSPATKVYVTVDSGEVDIDDAEVIIPADLTEAVKAKTFATIVKSPGVSRYRPIFAVAREAGITVTSNLNLWGTKVVTLSACETGVGEVKNGEGVYGLRRAFLLAGTETLVMSLWAVGDRSTRDIMTAYYSGLKEGLGRGEALRQAQLAMLQHKDRRHPFFWAGFIQSGEWKSLAGK